MNPITKTTNGMLLSAGALALGLSAGCGSNETANIGDGELSVDKNALASYAAEWDGYTEAYTFESGTDRVHLMLDVEGNGWLEIGEDPLPPPTDPDVGYPEGARDIAGLVAGFRYPIEGARVEEERIRFDVYTTDLYKEWCELQTPYEEDRCVPSDHVLLEGGGCFIDGVAFDCLKVDLCWGVCECDGTSCTAPHGKKEPVLIGAGLDETGNTLEGSLVMDSDTRVTLRLSR